MKNIPNKLFLAVAMIGFSITASAQDATASVATSANVITPIAITGDIALSFGDIVATATGGTVTVSTAGVRSSSDADLIVATAGTVAAASFTVTGQEDFTYAITLPAAFDVTSGTDTMGVASFISAPDATGTLTLGTETVTVGATLTVGATQAAGAYTSAADLAITVQYN